VLEGSAKEHDTGDHKLSRTQDSFSSNWLPFHHRVIGSMIRAC